MNWTDLNIVKERQKDAMKRRLVIDRDVIDS